MARAPGWLTALLEREPDPPPLAAVAVSRSDVAIAGFEDDSPAAAFNASTTWDQLLTRDGWTLARTMPSGEQRWTRPGKTSREGISATVGHAGRDVLKVFTSSIPELVADRAYSRFGYEAAVHHRGNRSALARELRHGMNRDRLAGIANGPTAGGRSSTIAETAREPSASM